MSKIMLTLQPAIDPNVFGRLRETIDKMGSGDEITINIESADAHQADPIIGFLNKSGFDHQSKGSNDGKNYYINARRKAH